jgi:hypothetical protein
MARLPLLLCSVLLLAAAACSPTPAPDAGAPGEAPQGSWQARGLRDYSFAFQRHCFCVREAVQPVRIVVRDGVVHEVRSQETGELIPPSPQIPWYTIDQLLEQAERAREDGQEVNVEYHSEGHPSRIEIGSLAADAGIVFEIEEVEELR